MPTIKRFEDIDAWKMSREMCGKLGRIIDSGTFKNSFKLINQIESSAGSVMDNIAEGFERGTTGEFIQFLGYSKGSCGEFRSQLYRAIDRNYITQEQFDDFILMAVRISAMLQKFIEYLQQTNLKGVRKK